MEHTPSAIRSAQVISVIRTESRAGAGTEEDPNRIVVHYWSLDGSLLATQDPFIQDALPPSSSQPFP